MGSTKICRLTEAGQVMCVDDEMEYLNESEADEEQPDNPEDDAELADEAPWPSEVFEGFLDYLSAFQKAHQDNAQELWKHERSLQDDLHAFEFCGTDEEAAELGIAFSRKRKERRARKDAMQLYEEGAKFYTDKSNKPFFDRMRSLIKKQKRQEEYLNGERHYNKRGVDEDEGN